MSKYGAALTGALGLGNVLEERKSQQGRRDKLRQQEIENQRAVTELALKEKLMAANLDQQKMENAIKLWGMMPEGEYKPEQMDMLGPIKNIAFEPTATESRLPSTSIAGFGELPGLEGPAPKGEMSFSENPERTAGMSRLRQPEDVRVRIAEMQVQAAQSRLQQTLASREYIARRLNEIRLQIAGDTNTIRRDELKAEYARLDREYAALDTQIDIANAQLQAATMRTRVSAQTPYLPQRMPWYGNMMEMPTPTTPPIDVGPAPQVTPRGGAKPPAAPMSAEEKAKLQIILGNMPDLMKRR